MGGAFLRIDHRVHAGVGMEVTRILLLWARGHQICPLLSITSGFTEDFMDFSRPRPSPKQVAVKTRYAVGLSLRKQLGPTMLNFQAIAAVRGKRESLSGPESNDQYDRRAALTFDPKQQIFYGAQEHISQRFLVFDPKAESETTQDVAGTFPVLTLGEYSYVYLSGHGPAVVAGFAPALPPPLLVLHRRVEGLRGCVAPLAAPPLSQRKRRQEHRRSRQLRLTPPLRCPRAQVLFVQQIAGNAQGPN